MFVINQGNNSLISGSSLGNHSVKRFTFIQSRNHQLPKWVCLKLNLCVCSYSRKILCINKVPVTRASSASQPALHQHLVSSLLLRNWECGDSCGRSSSCKTPPWWRRHWSASRGLCLRSLGTYSTPSLSSGLLYSLIFLIQALWLKAGSWCSWHPSQMTD